MISLALLALAAAPAPAPTPGPDWYYQCTVERTDALGTLTVRASIAQDGSAPYYESDWSTPPIATGARLWVRWRQSRWWQPGDEMLVQVVIGGAWRDRRPVRVELWRTANRGGSSNTTFAGPFYRQPRQAQTQGLLSDYRAFAAGIPMLFVAVVDRNTNMLAQGRIDTAAFDAPAAAMAAARPELERLIADHRNRCTLTEPQYVVIT